MQINRSSVCSDCGADLHCCRNCRFYDQGSHYDCHETVDEEVRDKERANFCDWFSPNAISGTHGGAEASLAAKNAFNSLFAD